MLNIENSLKKGGGGRNAKLAAMTVELTFIVILQFTEGVGKTETKCRQKGHTCSTRKLYTEKLVTCKGETCKWYGFSFLLVV